MGKERRGKKGMGRWGGRGEDLGERRS